MATKDPAKLAAKRIRNRAARLERYGEEYLKAYAKRKREEFYANHPEKKKEYEAKRREVHPDRQQKIYQAKREENIARVKEWRSRNPELHAAASRNYRARKLAAEGNHTAADIREQYKKQSGLCYWCDEPVGNKYHADHIVALTKGGTNDPSNLVIACPSCNSSKGNKDPDDFLKRIERRKSTSKIQPPLAI